MGEVSANNNRNTSAQRKNTNNSTSPKGPNRKNQFIIDKKSNHSTERSSSLNKNYEKTPNFKKSDTKKPNSGKKAETGLNKSVPKGKTGDKRTSEWEEAIKNEKKKKQMFGNKSTVVPGQNQDNKNARPNRGTKNPIDRMISFPYDDNDSFVFESSDDEPKPVVRNGNKQQEYANIRNSGGSGNLS